MRSFHIKILLALLLPLPGLEAQVKTISLVALGAKPNDNRSDQAAFTKAAEIINQLNGNVKLLIPAGKYIVGPDPAAGIKTGIVNDVLLLKDCNNVRIEGQGKVQLQFMKGLAFGTQTALIAGKDSAVHVGSLFRLINCSNIQIRNIRADGNSRNFQLLKPWGDGSHPYEREHEGLFILNCSKLLISALVLDNFGRDGAMVLQDPDKKPVEDLVFINCSFINNGRNGFSWCGGRDVKFYHCLFNNNGNGKIMTNPGAGLDIEPERNAVCTKGLFNNCAFSDNGGYAITSGYQESNEVLFDSCTIRGKTNYAVFCNSPGFEFKQSRIYGTSLFVYDAPDEASGTRLSACRFFDSESTNRYFINNYLVGVTGRYLRFTACEFTGNYSPLFYTEIKKKSQSNSSENTFFNKCIFNAFFTKPATWQNRAMLVSNSNFVDCIFNSRGVADFEQVLNDREKNLYKQHIKINKIIFN